MMKRSQSRSINQALLTMMMMITTIALIIAIIIFITSDLISTRRSFKEALFRLANVTAIQCTNFLAANDVEPIDVYLQTFKIIPDLKHALILTSNKQIVASYPRDSLKNNIPSNPILNQFEKLLSGAIAPEQSSRGIHQYRGKYLYFVKPIFLKDHHLGWIFLLGDTQNIYHDLRTGVFSAIFILIVCSGIVFGLARIWITKVSAPILNLAKAMDQVSSNKDYGLRIKNLQKDETGTLTKGFNELLARIQEQERDLKLTQYTLEHMSDLAIWTNREGDILYANAAACRKLDYQTQELSQMNLMEIGPEITPEKLEQIWKHTKSDKKEYLESSFKTKSEEIFPVEISNHRADLEEESYHCCFAKDISELRQMETQLQQAQDMAAVGQLAARVAHDLNNVLGGLISYPDLLLLEIPEDNHLRDTIQTIQKSGQQAADIVQDLLTLARRGTVTVKTTHLNKVITEILNSSEFSEQHLLPNPNIEIIQALDDNLQNITASIAHITKIIIYLMKNAFEEMPDGGQIQIMTENRRVENPVRGFEKIDMGDYAVLSISDTGVGISEGDLKKIFEPFYTKKVMGRKGTGLEMAIVRALVKEQHGFINMFSTKKGGTCFELYFPITHSDTTALAEQFSADDYLSTKNRA
jgi:PAS domain S-box-containing protein